MISLEVIMMNKISRLKRIDKYSSTPKFEYAGLKALLNGFLIIADGLVRITGILATANRLTIKSIEQFINKNLSITSPEESPLLYRVDDFGELHQLNS